MAVYLCASLAPVWAQESTQQQATAAASVPAQSAAPTQPATNAQAPANAVEQPVASGPINLEQALDIAFRNNPDLKISVDQLQRSQAVVAEARANFNPRFNAQIETLRQGPVSTVTFPGRGTVNLVQPTNTTATVTALLPLDINNRLGLATDISKYRFQIQYLTLMQTAEQLIFDVKAAYYTLLRACGQQEVAQAAVDVSARRLRETQSRFEAGVVPKFDVTSAEVDLANLNQSLIQAQNQVEIARTALNRVLGVSAASPTQVTSIDIPVSVTNVNIPDAIAQAKTQRPLVRIAETSIRLNEKNIKLQRSQLYPSLSANGVYNYNVEVAGLSSNKSSWQAGLTLSIPIWQGGIVQAQVNQAKADEQSARDTLDQAEITVGQQTRVAALGIEEAARRVSTTGQAVSLAEEALRLANVRYEAGIATLVEVLNAESQLTQARFNNVNALYDYATSIADLQRATATQPEMNKVQLLDSAPKAPQVSAGG